MGMVIEGVWVDQDRVIRHGRYERQSSVYASEISRGTIEAMGAEPGRFHLIASLSCPWSHRALIVRGLKHLGTEVPAQIAHGPRTEGYALNGGAAWTVPGADRQFVHLHELYALSDPAYTGRSTVPVLWDAKERSIASNDSAAIMQALDAVRATDGRVDFTLRPDGDAGEIDRLNTRIFDRLSNGVYRAGFAQRQGAYDTAVAGVFAMLDELEARLAGQRYLLGPAVTQADWRLLPTLLRFDPIYYVLHKCCRRRLTDYPNLWAYARDLIQWRGVAATMDFAAMRAGSYQNDTAGNPHGIVAVCPDADWCAPHRRERFGPAQIVLRSGERLDVDPATLDPLDGG